MAGLRARPRPAVLGAFAWLVAGAHGWGWGGGGSAPQMKKHATEELTPSNYDAFMKDNAITAVLFYAPWCFYSQQMMPAWDTAAAKLMLHDPPVKLAQLDAHRHRVIGDRYGINAFPTMKLFVDGSVFEFDGQQGRSWQNIINWVNRHIDRDHVLKSAGDVDHYLHDNDLNVVGLFPDGMNSSAFQKSLRHYDDVIFAESRGTELSKQVAEHLATHATLVCETVDIGHSEGNVKKQTLPRPKMNCTGDPRNPQRPEWTDRFAAEVVGETVSVTRTDSAGGWDQLLQIKCCDQESKTTTRHEIPVPSIVMFMPHDERYARYDGNLEDFHALDRWISARRTPMVMRLTPETAEKILDSGPEKLPALFLIQSTPDLALETTMRQAAKELRGKALVTLSGAHSSIEKRLMELAGVDDDALPVVTLLEVRQGGGPQHSSKKYRLPIGPAGLKASDVTKFVSDFDKGALKPWLKSEPAPMGDQGPVVVLVGSNFVDVALDHKVDVLVDFYAPWCGHCRKFEPAYKDLAKRLHHVKSLKIAKLDATRNEVEGMQIMGFPTVVLFPAHGGPSGSLSKQVHYQGGRTPEEIIRWLHSSCTHTFDETAPKEAAPEVRISGLLDPSEEDL